MTTPKLQLPELVVGQAGKELTHNQALAILSQLTQANVVDKDLAAPPGSPADGTMYIVAASATGAWAGKSGQLAFWLTSVGAWTFAVPVNGWSVWVADEAAQYTLIGGVWTVGSGGGGGGMTNPMTTAGDLIVGGVSGAPARLAKGTDGQVLKMVAGTEAWAAEAAAPSPYAFSAGKVGADQSIAKSATTKITFDAVSFNYGSSYNSSTSACTIPSGGDGLWVFGAAIVFTASAAGDLISPRVYKNGAQIANIGYTYAGTPTNPTCSGITMLDVVAGDVIELYVYLDTPSGSRVVLGIAGTTSFFGYKAN